MQIIPLNLDSVLLFLHNSKLAYWELKHATFLSRGRQPEVNISHARTVASLRFSK